MAEADNGGPALRYTKDGRIAWITADNPSRMNALTGAMWGALPAAIASAVADPDVRVVVLRGAGDKAFSAGADISEFESGRTGDAAKVYDALNDAAFEALITCPKPTIAMIHGFCLGGGLGLALCCDMRIADETSQFAIPAAKLGIGYNARWVRPILAAVPADRAKQLLFTGRRFRSADAEAMGLITQLVPKVEIEATVRALAVEIGENAPLSVAAAKLVIDEISRHPEHPDMKKLDDAVAACFASADYAEGRRAFLEKRKAEFKGT
jgi:enoyl-CoA hydratase/carnithine racemase